MTADDDRYAQALCAANVGTWRWDVRTNQVTWSDNIEQMFGLARGQFDGAYASFLSLLLDDDRQQLVDAIDRSLNHHQPYEIEHRIVWSNGVTHWYLGKGSVIRNSGGQPVEMVGTTQDITDRKVAELALRESQTLLTMAQALGNIGSWTWDIDSGRIVWSPQLYQIYGVAPEDAEVTFASAMEAVHPGDRAMVTEKVHSLLAGKESESFECRLVRPDGEMRHVWATTQVRRDSLGRVVGMIGTMQDVTDREWDARALRESESRLRQAMNIAQLGIWDWHIATDTTVWQGKMFDIYGVRPEKFTGKGADYIAYTRADYRNGQAENIKQVFAHGLTEKQLLSGVDIPVAAKELCIVRPDGSEVFTLGDAVAIVDEQGRPKRLVGITMDITARKHAEAEIQKLNAELEERVRDRTAQLETTNHELEAFCYSISHDLRAPLRAIDGFAHVVQEDYADKLDASGNEYLNRIRSGALRMNELIDALLGLSHLNRTVLVAAQVDLSALAQEILAQLTASTPQRAVSIEIAPGITARGDHRLLRIALTNLLDNAWKYTGKTPHARIVLGETLIDHERVFFVRDNGAGFEMQFAGKLFGPFQRLHNVLDFPGSGIGLATVARIIHRHGGRIWAEAVLGQGATFFFTLPES